MMRLVSGLVAEASSSACSTTVGTDCVGSDCVGGGLCVTGLGEVLGVGTWNEILSTSPDKYGGFGNELICSEMKRNTNGFQCFDDSKSPPTTRDEAVKHYAAAENTPESLCAPLKQNSPFECSRVLETTLVIRLSLSFAASQAIFDLFGLFLVFILRRGPVLAATE